MLGIRALREKFAANVLVSNSHVPKDLGSSV